MSDDVKLHPVDAGTAVEVIAKRLEKITVEQLKEELKGHQIVITKKTGEVLSKGNGPVAFPFFD